MIEMDFQTRYTVLVNGANRGGGSLAERANYVILRALAKDGFEVKPTPGNANPYTCATDVFRIEPVEDGAE